MCLHILVLLSAPLMGFATRSPSPNMFMFPDDVGGESNLRPTKAKTASRDESIHDINDGSMTNGNIFYVVRTYHKNYDTRLQSILKTWAAPLDSSSLLIVGDVGLQRPKVHVATGCSDDHWVGLNCKTGHSLALAADMIGSHPWVFLIDDDVYVNTAHLERTLSQQDPSKLVALGIPGCGSPKCDDHEGGFCGGGGYALSQAALRALVGKPTAKNFPGEFLDTMKAVYPDAKEVPYDDIVATCMMKHRGINIESMKGLYGWRLPGSTPSDGQLSTGYKSAIHSLDPPALTFHYIKPQEMYSIHDEIVRPKPDEISLVESNVTSTYDEQLKLYIQDHSRTRKALV